MNNVTDYYSVGSKDDIVTSNSSLSYINPQQGGSPKKFLSFFETDAERKTSLSLERGSLLHLWHEHREQFQISDIVKPSDMMSQWVERAYRYVSEQDMGLRVPDEVIAAAREDAYKNVKEPSKVIDKFRNEGMAYLQFLFDKEGKQIVDLPTKAILEGSMAAIENHRKANHLLFDKVPDGYQRFKELEIYWSVIVQDRQFKFKAKLDDFVINWNKREILLNDLKSTSKPVSLFKNSFITYRYYRQLAFYAEALIQYLKQIGQNPADWTIKPSIVAADYTKHFNVHVFQVDSKWMDKGKAEFEVLVGRVIYASLQNEWLYTPEEKANKGFLMLDYTEQDEIQSNSY